ncbi:TPA: cation-translocating P-type ATPase [Candidatus Bathyarchaeota archaeon]|nr:cation-translocating P-type ATPase [Candidatus Bathyarchaeota archaeon]
MKSKDVGKLDPQWHSKKIEAVILELGSDSKGLSAEKIELKRREFGYNELRERKKTSALQIFLSQFRNIFALMLIIALIISVVLGYYEAQVLHDSRITIEAFVDGIAIGAIVILNAIIGFVQEYRSEKAMDALKKLATPNARVIREGEEEQIPARELVPGDILLLEAGDRIAADGRLLEVIDISIDESVLTGESNAVCKTTETLAAETSISDRKNMVFTGTYVADGRGKAIVTSTGINTQFGKISEMVQTVEKEEIPLKLKLDRFAKKIGIIVIVAAVTILVFSLIRNGTLDIDLLLTSVALAVSAVPEGLPAVVTVTLALGAKELAKRNAVVRRLASVETLGSTTVICSDKTGTLTKGEMTVRKICYAKQTIDVTGTGYEPVGEFRSDNSTIFPLENEDLLLTLRIGALCNNSTINGSKVLGDPTEGALLVAASKANLKMDELKRQFPRFDEIPFSSERSLMTTVHQTQNGCQVAYIKGSLEKVLGICKYIQLEGKKEKLNPKLRNDLLNKNEEMANQALRVLAMAYRELPNQMPSYDEENLERDLVFVGLVGMIDPPREEAKEAVKLCEKARIMVVMITGDHKLTAVAVARELGILKTELALTGEELEVKSDEEFERIVETIRVYARVSPEHKLRIVKTLKKKGHIVAMTGDGVNDAPAVKQADIGIAMGITGTDVTKEASDMVLADDNFATIVNAVRGGRIIYDNIRKFIRFLISLNFTELILIGSFALIGLPIPLLPVMILWLNLVTDGPPAMALSVDPPNDDVMQRPPRNPKEGVLHGNLAFILASTLIQLIVEIIAFWWGYNFQGSTEKARTLVFAVACFYELVVIWNCRSESRHAFRVGFLNNKALLAAVIVSVLSTLAVIYTPALQFLFQTVTLNLTDLAVVAILSLAGFLIAPELLFKKKPKE